MQHPFPKRLLWALIAAAALAIEPAFAEMSPVEVAPVEPASAEPATMEPAPAAPAPVQTIADRCLYVSSFHAGHDWSDRVEKSLEAELQGKCELSRFYIDAQRQPAEKTAARKGSEAKKLIDQSQPRVVIACDDAASRHLVMPHLRDGAVPVVFCGVNESVEQYGYPYANTTGIVEVAPIAPLFDEVRNALGSVRRAVFLAADTPAQRRELAQFQRAYLDKGLIIDSALVTTMRDWEQAFLAAQDGDFVILSNATGMKGWNEARAVQLAEKRGKRLSVTIHEPMSRIAVLTMTKVPEEHGEWAAQAVLAILRGTSPRDIPIVPSTRWRSYVNDTLLNAIGVQLSEALVRDAIHTN
jgi:ABC-type uncharacterized transport system substrate-binding protein